jgi:nicotinate-nucleotide--dimethylbenzimidazole phosphoribosyltransferase
MIPVLALSEKLQTQIQSKIDSKTKPIGSLGQLETLALQLALITQQRVKNGDELVNIELTNPLMLVFAGDHGINKHHLSIAPSAVTRQMVLNFVQGGAAINCFCRSNDINFNVIDCGILASIDQSLSSNDILIEQRLGAGTCDFSSQAAMTATQVDLGLEYGERLVERSIEKGIDILLLGEMGIANTSSASAIMSALTDNSVLDCVGVGTGISPKQLNDKVTLISQAIERTGSGKDKASVLRVLSEVGGFEIVQMVGTILAAAKQALPIVVDGFIVSIAAFVAFKLDCNVKDYLIFSHLSQEKAHQLLLSEFNLPDNRKPLLNLALRLGEGTGAALALPIIKAAASFYNDMASFESAGVTV